MKATAANLVLAALVLAVAGVSIGAQRTPDLTGTWIGTTLVPDVGEDAITLELKREGNTYTGRCTDAAKVVVAPEIKNVAFTEGTLTFDIGVSGGTDTVTVHISLKADGDQMTGHWATADGESAGLKLARQTR
jgi:hypothetical protein